MTKEEYARLKIGDEVYVNTGGNWHKGKVVKTRAIKEVTVEAKSDWGNTHEYTQHYPEQVRTVEGEEHRQQAYARFIDALPSPGSKPSCLNDNHCWIELAPYGQKCANCGALESYGD